MHCFEEQFIRSFKLVKDCVSKDRIDTVSGGHRFYLGAYIFHLYGALLHPVDENFHCHREALHCVVAIIAVPRWNIAPFCCNCKPPR